ncbi:ABC transporter ATP-binding protein [Erythrobacter rubeus]|uniref:ATP-binding cassette domain-containing protein n=1 Tax=Erythrobacter rubeus TaxID=2760803 RepID=A0ABR8KLZ9_9SPHN|nr:ATP-binding cassette domain-containing protein [Erythrobacter rubeus]MBD2841465.1 ATP-binding cassette domain-containing protein [Erythrobacter rubeus]
MKLVANDLTLERGGQSVLKNVDTEFPPGTITAIVGPNGAGKSSLLLALAGLLEPVSGTVELDGERLSELPPLERAKTLGYLPQHTEIAWDVAVENVVALGRLPHRDRGTAEIETAIAALTLEPLRHRPARQLSGGEQARVLLARVLAGEPRWILADEPLAALDLAHQLSLVSHLQNCAHSGQGVVIVLHDLALAMNHADNAVVLHEGKCAASGPVEDALSSETIRSCWGVDAQWIGDRGSRALIIEH